MKTYVYIGRFQPVHNAHISIIQRALEEADRVIVLVGSANQPRTYKNPWTFDERSALIYKAVDPVCRGKITVASLEDRQYNDQEWAVQVQQVVQNIIGEENFSGAEISVIGHSKDDSSYYLKMFPQWTLVEHPLVEELSATDVRDLYFRKKYNPHFVCNVVPATTLEFLDEFHKTPEFQQILREREFVENYRKQFEHLKYPPVFVTVDAVVIQSGHVLMVQRRSEPGRGLWALPGGFLDAASDKSVRSAMLRELKEETKIKIPSAVLNGSVTDSRVFDAIGRSARGRTITHAFKIELPPGELPKIKASSDAACAQWIPISQVKPNECFEDHIDIIRWATGSN